MSKTYSFSEQQRDKATAKLEQLIGKVEDNDVIESLQEVLNLLSGIPDDKTLEQVIASAIETALGEEGAITTAISSAIAAAIGTDGSIETWADGRYEPKSGT